MGVRPGGHREEDVLLGVRAVQEEGHGGWPRQLPLRELHAHLRRDDPDLQLLHPRLRLQRHAHRLLLRRHR